MQQASYLEGDPPMWMLPQHLHINKKSDDDDDVCVEVLQPSQPNKVMSSMVSFIGQA